MFYNLRHRYGVFQYRILRYLIRGLLQRWTKSPIIPSSKGESVWRKNKKKRTVGIQIAYMVYDYFRVIGIHDFVENYADLFTIVLRNDDIQEFDSKWDGILLSMTKIPLDDLGRIVQIKNTRVWEIKDRIGIVRPGDSSEEVRTWLSQIENCGEKKYRARDSKFWDQKWTFLRRTPWSRIREQNSVYKEFLEIVGNGKPTGSVWKETIAVSATMPISVEKLYRQNRLRSVSSERAKIIENPKSQRKVPVLECLDGLARITSEELAITHFCEKWHPPECLFCKTKSACRFGEKCSYAHRHVDEQPTKRSKKIDDKCAVAMLKKGDWYERGPFTDQCPDRPGKPGKRSDKKLGQKSSQRRSSDARQLGCGFQDMTPLKSILRKSADMRKPIQRVKFTKAMRAMLKFETKIPRSVTFVQVNLMSVAPTLQNLRIDLYRRQSGKSKVPATQRGSWPKICQN